ncbi:LytR/AlgR family response regulator transcription factor [Mucilaginibacter ximonensis]|uniref:LytR/AlgR family response regulator transcription factor n=1 Tax=Mucilaginibacter ximonensis TaxID=538021 RepID=A0ABW5YG45_9SPHI
MSIKAIIVDDEANNIENLQLIIKAYCPEVDVIATAQNADEGLTMIQRYQPDLLFLDIQMPQRSGFDLLAAIPQIDFEIIFITAYDKYGIRAIKFSALDYLLKPINIDEFKAAVLKARKKIESKKHNLSIENLLHYIKAGNTAIPKIALPTLKEIMYVKVTDIVRCEASNSYTLFYLQNGEQVLVCKTLREFADLLKPYNFIRSHQSHLVNINFIKSYLSEDGGTLLLINAQKVPISRQNRETVKSALNNIV